jgi:flagellar biogenesis protein FliO
MHAVVRSALCLAVMGLAGGVCHRAAGDYPDRYSQAPSGWDGASQAAAREAPAPWPTAPAPPAGTNPPRLLPGQSAPAPYPAPAGPTQPVGGYAATPVSAESKIPPPPIPLSRAATGESSPGGGDLPPLASTAASLGLVVGLFLLVAWVVRRGMPKGAGLLPSDAVEVLGRAPFVGRQQVHLVRCGNKIVLVTVTPSGTQTLTEISDPAEVDRLQNLCQPAATGSLRGWLSQFTQPRGSDYREPPDGLDFRHLEIGQHHS